MSKGWPVVAFAAAAAIVLVAAYLLLGGASYDPTPVADPCRSRPWRAPGGVPETVEQIALSTADGAACTLGVSREQLVLALASRDELARFAAENDISEEQTERAVREGLERAIDDAERAEAIGGDLAGVLRTAASRLPLSLLLEILRGASSLLPG